MKRRPVRYIARKTGQWIGVVITNGKKKSLMCLCPDQFTANIVIGALREAT